MRIFVATYSARRATIIPFTGHTKDEALTACANEIRQRFYQNGDVPSDPYKLLMKAQQDSFIKGFDVRETEIHMPTIVVDASGGVFHGVHVDGHEPEPDITVVLIDSDTEIGADHCIVESNSCLAENNKLYGAVFKPTKLDGLGANELVDALKKKGEDAAARQDDIPTYESSTMYWGDWSFEDETYIQDAYTFNLISVPHFMSANSIATMEGTFFVNHGHCKVTDIALTRENFRTGAVQKVTQPVDKVPILVNVGWDNGVGIASANETLAAAFAELGALALAKDKKKQEASYRVSIDHNKEVSISEA